MEKSIINRPTNSKLLNLKAPYIVLAKKLTTAEITTLTLNICLLFSFVGVETKLTSNFSALLIPIIVAIANISP